MGARARVLMQVDVHLVRVRVRVRVTVRVRVSLGAVNQILRLGGEHSSTSFCRGVIGTVCHLTGYLPGIYGSIRNRIRNRILMKNRSMRYRMIPYPKAPLVISLHG